MSLLRSQKVGDFVSVIAFGLKLHSPGVSLVEVCLGSGFLSCPFLLGLAKTSFFSKTLGAICLFFFEGIIYFLPLGWFFVFL